MEKGLSHIFGNEVCNKPSAFQKALEDVFGQDGTAEKVMAIMTSLQIELPENKNEFMEGKEGVFLFSNRYGVILRIERKDNFSFRHATRINDDPFILQPLGSFDAGSAMVEICPGCHSHDNDYEDAVYLQASFRSRGIDFWDADSPNNMGLLPYKTDFFPEGVPVVIDRLAVLRLSNQVADIKSYLKHAGLAEDPQEKLYGPLKKALAAAWPAGQEKADVFKMRAFWALCANETRKGTLVAGWNEGPEGAYKKRDARDVAYFYDQTVATKFKRLTFAKPKMAAAPAA